MAGDVPTIDYTYSVVKALDVTGYVGSIIVNPGGYSIPAGGISTAFTTQSTSLVCYKADGTTDLYVTDSAYAFGAKDEVTMTGFVCRQYLSGTADH